MRVTNRMLMETILANIHRNVEALDRTQHQVSSGKRVTRPGEDPVAAGLGVRLRTERGAQDQYLRNIDQARTWLAATDQALGEASNTLQRIRELAVQAANDTYGAADRATISKEVDQLRDHLIDTLNSTILGDQYIFAGMKTTTAPFSKDVAGNAVYNGDSNTVAREIGPGVTIPVNVDGSTFLTTLADLKSLADALADPLSTSAQISGLLTNLDADADLVLATRAEVGAKLNRLDFMQDRLNDLVVEVGRLQSANEDVDLADALLRLSTQEAVLRASLQIGARTAAMSILDFLK
jgi:flagellar hook-associated protein 3 FlgL